MATKWGEPTSTSSASNLSYGNNNNDASEFECNICFDIANYPVVTLCGHLFCWPCLHQWLRLHSQSQECPVCKALIQEDKLVPIYGRGKNPSDPRSGPVPGVDIPSRPHGERPETAQPPPQLVQDRNYFSNLGFGFLGGVLPFATANFNFQFHGFPGASMYDTAHGYPFGYAHTFHGGYNSHGRRGRVGGRRWYQMNQGQGQDSALKSLLIMVGLLVFLSLFWS